VKGGWYFGRWTQWGFDNPRAALSLALPFNWRRVARSIQSFSYRAGRYWKRSTRAVAAIDVFDIEPLPPSHPFRTLDNVLATPHIGYVSHGLYKTFYEDTVSNVRKWLDTQ